MSDNQKFAPPSLLGGGDAETEFEFKPLEIPKIDKTEQLIEQALEPPKTKTKRTYLCGGCGNPNCYFSYVVEE